jgi:ribosomal protein L33
MSTALTGFFYTTTRVRTAHKLSFVKYDPKGELLCGYLRAICPQ